MITIQGAKGPRLSLDPTSVFDVGSCFVEGIDVSPRRAIPDDGDPRIDHALEGFLFTCGPDHIRHPAIDKAGLRYPLHGSAAGQAAEDLHFASQGEDLVATSTVPLALVGGHGAQLHREWRVRESGEVALSDRVTNVGATAFPCFWMYHMNLAAMHFDDATRLEGAMLEGGGLPWAFGAGDGGLFCVPAGHGGRAELRLGPIAALGGRTLRVWFRTDTLPYLQVWRNQRSPAHVLGIEPVSHRLADRSALEAAGETVLLAPGESRTYGLSFSFG